MDWVEVFAPVVFEPYRPRVAESGSLLPGDLPFRVPTRTPDVPGSRSACSPRWGTSTGAENHGAGRRLRARREADWGAFLAALPGARERVVCDNDDGLTGAVRAFPRRRAVPVRVASASRA